MLYYLMETFSSKIFFRNDKRTAIIMTFVSFNDNYRRFDLYLPLILQKRFERNPDLDLKQLYPYNPESELFTKNIDFDIVLCITQNPEDDKCPKIYKEIYEKFKMNIVNIFTDINDLLKEYPEALYTNEENIARRKVIYEENTVLQKSKLSPVYDQKPSEILPNLFLGPVEFASDEKFLNEKNIGAIVTIMQEPLSLMSINKDLRLHHIPILDSSNIKMNDYKDDCIKFITKCFEDGLNVYIHCKMGISRSVSFVIAFLMHSRNMRFHESFEHVRTCRPQADPNLGFYCQLLEFEKELFK